MKKPLLLFILFSFFGIYLNAQDVYVNKISMKYHTENCTKVNDKYYTITLKEAIDAGCTPCKECSPLTKIVKENSENTDLSIEFSKVIYTDSVGKTKLYVTINDWFATNFKSANDVIQMADKEAGIIIGKGNFSYYYENDKTLFSNYSGFTGYIEYTIKVYIKDNRYKVEIFNFSHKSTNVSNSLSLGRITKTVPIATTYKMIMQRYYEDVWSNMIPKIKSYSEDIFTSLEQATKKVKSENDDDGW